VGLARAKPALGKDGLRGEREKEEEGGEEERENEERGRATPSDESKKAACGGRLFRSPSEL